MTAAESATTVSIRLVWPFARLSGAGPRALEMLQRAGIDPADFANPDTQLARSLVIELLEEAVERRGEPALGLEAGSLVEPQDLSPLALASEQHARRLLEQLRPREDVASPVRRFIIGNIGNDEVTMEASAAHLGMSVATLRRRLELENTTFRKTLDSMRRELAERYLADTGMALNEIAFLLGFSNQATFNRAFRRWNGATPNEYRARMLGR